MSIRDALRRKAEELELEAKARTVQDAVVQAARQAREKAGDFTSEHREQIEGFVDSASTKVDEKTEGRYADRVAKVRATVGKGIDKVAEGGAAPPSPPSAPPSAPPGESGPSASDESGFAAAAGDVPAPTREALSDSALEDTILGLDTPPRPRGTTPGPEAEG